MKAECAKLGIELHGAGSYGVGQVFLSTTKEGQHACQRGYRNRKGLRIDHLLTPLAVKSRVRRGPEVPWYSAYHYSHPTAVERITAEKVGTPVSGASSSQSEAKGSPFVITERSRS